jgi:hypothetical protein
VNRQSAIGNGLATFGTRFIGKRQTGNGKRKIQLSFSAFGG